jgi:mRNA-degrading endonuclease toxin of MazEF toxin-antitoxin module
MPSPAPLRGEIWIVGTGNPPKRHWAVVVSLNGRNQNPRADSVLVVPFGSKPAGAPSVIRFEPGETGLPGTSHLRADLIQVALKERLHERLPRPLSNRRMKEVCGAIRRSFDPDALSDTSSV